MVDVQAKSRGRHAGHYIGDTTERDGWITMFEPGGHLSPVPDRHPIVPAQPAVVGMRLLSPLRLIRHVAPVRLRALVGIEGRVSTGRMDGVERRFPVSREEVEAYLASMLGGGSESHREFKKRILSERSPLRALLCERQ